MLASALPLRHLALAALLLTTSLPAAAADGSLEIFHGPDQSGWLTLRSLDFKLDGVPLPVPLPGSAHDPAKILLQGPLSAGAHRLDVVANLDGASSVFTYVDGLRFTMRGVLQLDVVPGDVVEVHTRVVTQEGVTVKWEERYRLSLEATIRRSGQPNLAVTAQTEQTTASGPTAAPAPAPAVAAAPTPAPAPAAAPAPPPALAPAPAAAPRPAAVARTCALEPIRFAFDRSELTAEGVVALDRFAACLAASGGAVRVEGHCDSTGPDVYNEWLGAQRAAAAARHLRQRGVAPERITVRSMSAGSPLCSEADGACRARNRRIEAVIVP